MEHHFNVNLAIRLGIEKAAIINNLYYWINHNAKNNKNIYEGKVWTFNSTGAFAKLIPYIKERTLYRYLNELEKAKVISIGNFNKNSFDKTKWYSFTDEFVKILEAEGYDVENIIVCQNVNIDIHKMANRDTQSGETIPCNKQMLKTNKKDIDKSISQKDTEQGCGDKLPPSDASLPFPPASDASSPDVVGSSENTACGVNVNSFKAPLPPTPRMSSDVYVNEFVERMYAMYPAKCPQRNKSTGKSDKDRSRIKKLLKKYTMEQIELVFRYEIEQKYNKSYMSNFSTFLNNFPDPTQIGVHADNGSADNNSNEPALPNGMTREMYEMYIRNGYEIDEYGRIYKDGIMLK